MFRIFKRKRTVPPPAPAPEPAPEPERRLKWSDFPNAVEDTPPHPSPDLPFDV